MKTGTLLYSIIFSVCALLCGGSTAIAQGLQQAARGQAIFSPGSRESITQINNSKLTADLCSNCIHCGMKPKQTAAVEDEVPAEPATAGEIPGDTTTAKVAPAAKINSYASAQYRGNEDDIVLYPNPAINEITLSFPATVDIKTASIYNNIGKLVSVYKVTSNSAALNIESLLGGIYFARLSNTAGDLVATIRFTKQ